MTPIMRADKLGNSSSPTSYNGVCRLKYKDSLLPTGACGATSEIFKGTRWHHFGNVSNDLLYAR